MTDYNDGQWHGWNGGKCPVHPESLVEVMTGEGLRATVTAKAVGWAGVEANGTRALIAFRVTKLYVEPKKPHEFWIILNIGSGYPPDVFGTNPELDHRYIKSLDRQIIHVREVLPD